MKRSRKRKRVSKCKATGIVNSSGLNIEEAIEDIIEEDIGTDDKIELHMFTIEIKLPPRTKQRNHPFAGELIGTVLNSEENMLELSLPDPTLLQNSPPGMQRWLLNEQDEFHGNEFTLINHSWSAEAKVRLVRTKFPVIDKNGGNGEANS